MQGSDYIFSIMSANNLFWQPDAMGNVVLNPNPYFLKFSPEGWQDITIQNIRNMRLWGVDRSVTLPLSYVNDGAQILKNIFYKLGTEANAHLVICKQEIDYTPGVSYFYWYRQIYKGEIDLSTAVHFGAKFTCTTLEDGLPKYFKSNEATVYELPLNVVDAVNVQMDGINLHEKSNYKDIDQLDVSRSNYGMVFYTPSIFISSEGDSTGVLMTSQTVSAAGSLASIQAGTNCIFTNIGKVPINVTISGTFEFICTQFGLLQAPYALRIQFVTSTMSSSDYNTRYVVSEWGPLIQNATYRQNFTQTISLVANEKLYIIGTFYNGNGGAYEIVIQFTANSKYSLTFVTRKPATYIQAFRPQYIFAQLITKITDAKFIADTSSYFDQYKNIVFTCGNGIRGMKDAVMKVSFADFFNFWDCFDSVSVSQQGSTVLFDSKVNSIDKTTVIDLPNPSNFKVSVHKPFLFNELEIGYPEIKNDVGVLNGNQETNCKYLFGIGTVKSPAKINKVTKMKGSPYEIEKIRTTILPKDSTDYKSDNENFAIVTDFILQPATTASILPYYLLDRSLNSVTTGILEPLTIFNLAISPKRMIMNNGPFLRSCLFMSDSRILAYKTCDKNNKMVCNAVVEKADIRIGDLGDKIFHPIILEFETPAPINLIELLDANPLQIFSVEFLGNIYTGIPIKVAINPSNDKKQSYQLLALPENDLSLLISYYG